MSTTGNADGYWRPREPCNSCSVQALDCIVHRSHGQSCYPCVILSRQCRVEPVPETSLDRSSPLIEGSMDRDDLGHGSSEFGSSEPPIITRSSSRSRSRTRLSSFQVNILEDWAQRNEEHPYPTDLEKLTLRQQTSLSYTQVCNWFTNYRRKRKATLQKERNSRLTTQHQIGQPIHIQAPATEVWECLDPLQRWRQSPPEVEPATLDDISAALGTVGILQGSGTSDGAASRQSYLGSDPDATSLWMSDLVDRVPSVASGNSFDSRCSGDSLSSHSTTSARARPGTPRFRRRNRRRTARKSSDSKDRRFQCTFCTDRFKTKFDWVRHEKTLHLSLETWTCPGASPEEFQSRISSIPTCVFCDSEYTSVEHYASHSPTSCASIFDKPGTGRLFFFRKDHLQQHLRSSHNTQTISDTIQTYWKSEITHIRSRCGFCNAHFTTWNERVIHLAQEFRNGAEMKNWEGSRGFDAEVEARATLSMPPYLIDVDTKSQTPFSASDPWSVLHHANLFPNQRRVDYLSGAVNPGEDYIENPLDHLGTITYWEKIGFELGRWAQAEMQKGIHVTDQMIQEQGRLMVYGNIDPWNQTEADHPQWLAEFKVKYGIHQQQPIANVHADFPLFDMDPDNSSKEQYVDEEIMQPLREFETIGLDWNAQLPNFLEDQYQLD